jgi:23S rRNA G2445 N2-methylase RlmL
MLNHNVWFSKKPYLQRLTVAECIRQYPKFMIWAYQNLSINWSVYVISEMEELTKRKYVKPAKNTPRLTVLVSL